MKCACMKVYSLSDQRADTKNMAGWETLEEKKEYAAAEERRRIRLNR